MSSTEEVKASRPDTNVDKDKPEDSMKKAPKGRKKEGKQKPTDESDRPRQRQRQKPSNGANDAGDTTSNEKIIERGVAGVVRWYSLDKHYGFIARNDGTGGDIFVHQSAIVKSYWVKNYLRSLDFDEPVVFDIAQDKRGVKAVNVTGPDGANVRGNRLLPLLYFHSRMPHFPPGLCFGQRMRFPGGGAYGPRRRTTSEGKQKKEVVADDEKGSGTEKKTEGRNRNGESPQIRKPRPRPTFAERYFSDRGFNGAKRGGGDAEKEMNDEVEKVVKEVVECVIKQKPKRKPKEAAAEPSDEGSVEELLSDATQPDTTDTNSHQETENEDEHKEEKKSPGEA